MVYSPLRLFCIRAVVTPGELVWGYVSACTRKEKNMAKKIVGFIKLQVPAGKANPSPPIGPALGQCGLNIMEFCKAFNAQTVRFGRFAKKGGFS